MMPPLPPDAVEALRAAFELADWVQDRLGVRNLAALERLAYGDPAAAAVWCAVTTHDPARLRAALDEVAPEPVCRHVAELCCATINPGRGGDREGRYFACRIWSQERADFDDLADAVLWCLEGVIDVGSAKAVAEANAAARARWGRP